MYRDCREGPFSTQKEAEDFAKAEVGVRCRVAHTARGWIVEVECEDDLPPLPKDLRCPECGNHRMLYVEDICCTRHVEGFNDDGTLLVNGLYSTAGWDDGENPRITCSSCLKEFSAVRESIDFI